MARAGGNPDFGTKYRGKRAGDEALSEQIKVQVSPEVKLQVKTVAEQKNCSVPDVMRDALAQYLSNVSLAEL